MNLLQLVLESITFAFCKSNLSTGVVVLDLEAVECRLLTVDFLLSSSKVAVGLI